MKQVRWLACIALAALAACSSRPRDPAPVEERALSRPAPVSQRVLPGAENAGKPGFYTVKPGDTLVRIGMDTGQNWRDLVRWNSLDNPDRIEVGQVLRVTPPEGAAPRPMPAQAATTAAPASATASAAASEPRAAASAPAASPAPAAAPAASDAGDEAVAFQWPLRGPVLAGFDEAKNKGLDLGGKLGDPVHAAADGKVVYAGSGLRGYGNLIILKHNNTFLTAYAHNQSLLVKEDQNVRKGQKIAEMGNSDTDQVKLHFEIRRQGKPVDPLRYLPPQ
jgi:lipoprotein NlpD